MASLSSSFTLHCNSVQRVKSLGYSTCSQIRRNFKYLDTFLMSYYPAIALRSDHFMEILKIALSKSA